MLVGGPKDLDSWVGISGISIRITRSNKLLLGGNRLKDSAPGVPEKVDLLAEPVKVTGPLGIGTPSGPMRG